MWILKGYKLYYIGYICLLFVRLGMLVKYSYYWFEIYFDMFYDVEIFVNCDNVYNIIFCFVFSMEYFNFLYESMIFLVKVVLYFLCYL